MMRAASLLLVLAFAAAGAAHVHPAGGRAPDRRLSFHNRLLLNRAAVSGLESIEVLALAAAANEFRPAARGLTSLVERLGGRVLRIEPAVGYLHVEVPIDRFWELAASPAVAACQISSNSRASWYRDGPPMLNATMFRGFETTPIAAHEPGDAYAALPPLSIEASRTPGYTADGDVGIQGWLAEHPAYDGRGVTVAIVENGVPAFRDPTIHATVPTLDGRTAAKIAGIVNTIDAAIPDDTRVVLDGDVHAETTWSRIGARTYILPRPGRYRFGLLSLPAGHNLVHQFGVLEDPGTREVWLDANGDASFQDESPLADVNERYDPRVLTLRHPRQAEVGFVMGRGGAPGTVHIYVARGAHQTMTASVAAGARTDQSLAYGVAPGARLLLVRNNFSNPHLPSLFRGFIEAAKRPDVDVITSAAGLTIVPDTAAEFTGLLFSRLIDVYGKPIFLSAGNTHFELGTAKAFGDAMSVGGSLGPATVAALHGGRPLDRVIVHPVSAAGPSIDGAIKPDFLAPMERLAADLPWNRDLSSVPRNAPAFRLPAGYQISCCTSASAPYAAGVAALLISAAKQEKVAYAAGSLSRAMRLSARFLPGFGPHEQGNGVLDVGAAWRALLDGTAVPRITATARIVHPLARYSAGGSAGQGIFEFEGWTAGTSGSREIRLARHSGPDLPVRFRLSWSGNDGTFTAPAAVTLPLGKAVAVPIGIAAPSSGVHAALLNLHDEASGRIVFRTQATIVAAERIGTSSRSLRFAGRVSPLRINTHYLHVPAGVAAVRFDLEVVRGAVMPTILPAHGLFPSYYLHVHPAPGRYVGTGTHTVLIPNPEPGTWAIQLDNSSTQPRFSDDPTPADENEAEYAVTVGILDATIAATRSPDGSIAAAAANRGSVVREPVFAVSRGRLRTHRGAFPASGLPRSIEISVPPDAAALSLRARADPAGGSGIELFLYDCTTGECFSYDIAFPAAPAHSIVVRRPNAGRWVAAVNPAPFPAAPGGFALEEIVTMGTPRRHETRTPRRPGARWVTPLPADASWGSPRSEDEIVVVELIDAAAERAESTNRWDPRTEVPEPMRLRDRPVAIGVAVVPSSPLLDQR